MELHLFCHNELPMLLASIPVLGGLLYSIRNAIRGWLHKGHKDCCLDKDN